MKINIPVFIREKICPMCGGHRDQHGVCVVCTGCYPLYRLLEPETRRAIKCLLPLTRKQKTETRRKRGQPLQPRKAGPEPMTIGFTPRSALDRFLTRKAA